MVWGWSSHGLQASGEKMWEEPASAPAPALQVSSTTEEKDSCAARTH